MSSRGGSLPSVATGVAPQALDDAAMMGAIPQALVGFDAEGHILWLNPAAEVLSGWAADDLRGHSFTEFVRAEDLWGLRRSLVRQRHLPSSLASCSLIVSGTEPLPVVFQLTRVNRDPGGQFLAVLSDAATVGAQHDALRRHTTDPSATPPTEHTVPAYAFKSIIVGQSVEIDVMIISKIDRNAKRQILGNPQISKHLQQFIPRIKILISPEISL